MNIEAFAGSINALVESYVQNEVRPPLQALLDKAARRMHRHELDFTQGMGTYCLSINGDTGHALNDGVENAAIDLIGRRNSRQARLAARFPELVEFIRAVHHCDSFLNTEVGDMLPTKFKGKRKAKA